MKKKLTLTINEDILTTARHHNINLSSFLELKLMEYLKNTRIEHVLNTYDLDLQHRENNNLTEVRAPGIEPEQKAWKALIITPRSHPRCIRLRHFARLRPI